MSMLYSTALLFGMPYFGARLFSKQMDDTKSGRRSKIRSCSLPRGQSQNDLEGPIDTRFEPADSLPEAPIYKHCMRIYSFLTLTRPYYDRCYGSTVLHY